jgi:hypothetical protein
MGSGCSQLVARIRLLFNGRKKSEQRVDLLCLAPLNIEVADVFRYQCKHCSSSALLL